MRKGSVKVPRLAVPAAAALLLPVLLFTPIGAVAKGGGNRGSYSSATHGHPATGVTRDAHGKIARSPRAKSQFRKANPCPATGTTYGSCPDFVIDPVTPLKRGGSDAPANTQWQTQAEARAKDRIE